jgi:hypothetical protein
MVLSGMDTPQFFGQIKDKNVRNFYETILKSCCREKEPKERHLKNIFRMNKNKNQRNSFVLKSKEKDKINNSINNSKIENTEKKFRTSSSLPYIVLPQNISTISTNNDNEKTNVKNSNNKKMQSLFSKAANNNDLNNHKNKIKLRPISRSAKKNTIFEKTNLFKTAIICLDKDKEKEKEKEKKEYKRQKSLDSKK